MTHAGPVRTKLHFVFHAVTHPCASRWHAQTVRQWETEPPEPLHPEIVIAVWHLDAAEMPFAELWRQLRPIAGKTGKPRPSYARVRRLAIQVRAVKQRRKEAIDRQLSNAFRGLGPLA